MARPVVLVATTDPAMAYALGKRLSDVCLRLGLNLEICPGGDGDERDFDGSKVRAYNSAEVLFEHLASRPPMELADTLVVLDVGSRLKEAFEPKAAGDQGWHVAENRAGVAVELILRFPQAFSVILSPAVPTDNSPMGEQCNVRDPIPLSEHLTGNGWEGYRSLATALCREVKDETAQHLYALKVPLHFVSPLDAAGLCSVLKRFAYGMRCWFDPTGLRTLVKHRFLGTLFGDVANWKNTAGQRGILRQRLSNVAVAIDEEREFALLNAYAAWKYGRRAWIVTSYHEFSQHLLWGHKEGEANNTVILRDIDLRFPDISRFGIRDALKDIYSEEWKGKIGPECEVRAVSGEANVIPVEQRLQRWKYASWWPTQKRLGQDMTTVDAAKYLGFQKPVSSIYVLKYAVEDRKAKGSLHARLIGIQGDAPTQTAQKGGGHGAPYLNLAMAESLLVQGRQCGEGPSACVIGALLASEAYELLLGMSKTTALEALLDMHRAEVRAEVSFPGVGHSLRIKERKKDIEATLERLYENSKIANKKQIINIFLSQFWGDLRVIYRGAEHFDAAERANLESLVHSQWLRLPWRPLFISRCKRCSGAKVWLKNRILDPATSLWKWALWVFAASIVFTLVYGPTLGVWSNADEPYKWHEFYEQWHEVIRSSMALEMMGKLAEEVGKPGAELWLRIVALIHLGFSYLFFGLLITMLYRKITRE